MSMTPERHIWSCANTLIQQHGDDAWIHDSMRAERSHFAQNTYGEFDQ